MFFIRKDGLIRDPSINKIFNPNDGSWDAQRYWDWRSCPANIPPPDPQDPNVVALEQMIFKKLDVYRAMKALGNANVLKAALKANEEFEFEWNCATEINVTDPTVAQALALMQVDVNAIKIKIWEMNHAQS